MQIPRLLGTWPNTYTFTKALAEDYVRENSRGLPIGIFRPGIGEPTRLINTASCPTAVTRDHYKMVNSRRDPVPRLRYPDSRRCYVIECVRVCVLLLLKHFHQKCVSQRRSPPDMLPIWKKRLRRSLFSRFDMKTLSGLGVLEIVLLRRWLWSWLWIDRVVKWSFCVCMLTTLLFWGSVCLLGKMFLYLVSYDVRI